MANVAVQMLNRNMVAFRCLVSCVMIDDEVKNHTRPSVVDADNRYPMPVRIIFPLEHQ